MAVSPPPASPPEEPPLAERSRLQEPSCQARQQGLHGRSTRTTAGRRAGGIVIGRIENVASLDMSISRIFSQSYQLAVHLIQLVRKIYQTLRTISNRLHLFLMRSMSF